ncbi:MAG: hypothetical protein LBD99_00550 [Candidatus Margulisbacteria bacterium]|jgi:hypothetical protein|nr:hypothetical protein [Candidatus Margulisiibacteriota bacterium]
MVKKILILGLLLVWLLTAAGPDEYYSRTERLLAGLNTMVLQAGALPVITGALDEARKNPAPYYQNISLLADARENRAWRAYENSRRQTRVYSAARLIDQTLSRTSAGEQKYFYDEISGAKYRREDRRVARAAFFANYAAKARGADGYLENILIPASQYLEQLLVIELPELPDPDGAGFELPELPVPELGRQSRRPETRDFQWKLQPEFAYGVKRRVNENTIAPDYNFGVGLKIISPEGMLVKTAEQLAGLLPLAAIVPLPENARQLVSFKADVAAPETLAFADTPERAAPGRPLLVNYSLPADIRVVEFTVSDALGRPLYARKESAPDPANPLPFVWTPPKNTDEYYAELKGYDQQNKISKTAPKLLGQRAVFQPDYRTVPARQSGDYYGILDLSALPAAQGLHKIYFWLYGTEDAAGRPLAASVYVTFSTFAPEHSSLTAGTETPRGQKLRLRVQLLDKQREPVSGARVKFFSRRNSWKMIDKFSPDSALTDALGEVWTDFVSDIPGEAEIFALSDQVWVNASPLVVKVRD